MIIMAALAMAAVSAFATDVGVRLSHTTSTDASPAVGVTLGQKFGAYGVEGSFDRSTVGPVNLNKYGVVGSYDIAKFGSVTVAPKIGVVYIDPSIGRSGTALTVGVGASYPLTKQVSLTADYAYQRGQNSVRPYNGNYFAVGAKYSF